LLDSFSFNEQNEHAVDDTSDFGVRVGAFQRFVAKIYVLKEREERKEIGHFSVAESGEVFGE